MKIKKILMLLPVVPISLTALIITSCSDEKKSNLIDKVEEPKDVSSTNKPSEEQPKTEDQENNTKTKSNTDSNEEVNSNSEEQKKEEQENNTQEENNKVSDNNNIIPKTQIAPKMINKQEQELINKEETKKEVQYIYNLKDNTSTVMGFKNPNTNLKNLHFNEDISIENNEYKITSIFQEAFKDKKIQSLVLPSSLNKIEKEAFLNNEIKEVKIPESIKSIEKDAFDSTVIIDGLTKPETDFYWTLDETKKEATINGIWKKEIIENHLKIPSEIVIRSQEYKVSTINENAFENLNLKTVEIPETITEIKSWSFFGNDLEEIKFPKNIKDIGSGAFSSNSIKYIEIPNTLNEIKDHVFESNYISTLKIPSNIKTIGENAFNDNKLIYVDINNSVTEIKKWAFSENNIKNLKLPENLIKIEEGSFSDNELITVILPDSIKEIRSHSFENNNIKSIFIPENTKIIDKQAFYNNKIEDVVIPNNIIAINKSAFDENTLILNLSEEDKYYYWELDQKNNTAKINGLWNKKIIDKKLEIPETIKIRNKIYTVQEIGEEAFSNLDISHLFIPKSIKTIGINAFSNNPIQTLVLNNNSKQILENSIDKINNPIIILRITSK